MSLFRGVDAPFRIVEHVRALAPDLAIGQLASDLRRARSADGTANDATDATDATEAERLALEGYARLDHAVAEPALRASLIGAIERLAASGLPAAFVYLFDDTWRIGEELRARVSAMLGSTYVLGDDGWAWQVLPGQDGWAPHRDDRRLLERAAPGRVNVWVALTDTPRNRSCIHVVPLGDDRDYPGNLPANEVAGRVVELPVTGGTGLLWNANLLHWGGRCAPDAAGTRVAISYTFIRADAVDELAFPVTTMECLTPERRVDTVARLVARYVE